ncbi:MAG: sigma-E processing peptidase SpoIIGA [Bacillota bacterium]
MLGSAAYRIEILFLVNLVINGLLFWFAGSISWARPRWWRILLSAAVGAGFALLPAVAPWGRWFLTAPAVLILSLLLMLLVVWPCSRHQFVSAYGALWIVVGAAGGVNMLLAEQYNLAGQLLPVVLVAGGVGGGLAGLLLVWQGYRERKVVRDALCPLQIRFGEQRVELTGLVDSGNALRTPVVRRPVAIVEVEPLRQHLPPGVLEALTMGWHALEAIPAPWRSRCQLIPYSAVGSPEGALLAVVPDELRLWDGAGRRWIQVAGVIGLTLQPLDPQGHYQALLSPEMQQEAEGK